MRWHILLSVLLLQAYLCSSEIEFGDVASLLGGGSGKKEKEIVPARKDDIKYIRCGVCKKIAEESTHLTAQLRDAVSHASKLVESDIIDKLELLCDYNRDEGDWINRIDLIERGSRLDVVDMGKVGSCNTECATVARTCTDLMEDVDLTEMSTLLYRQKPLEELQDWLCQDVTGACSRKAPALPKGREPGPEHVPLSDEDLSTRDMMRRMSASGMNGQLFNTESFKQQMGGVGDGEDEDDEGDSGNSNDGSKSEL